MANRADLVPGFDLAVPGVKIFIVPPCDGIFTRTLPLFSSSAKQNSVAGVGLTSGQRERNQSG
jgi:hypothetical protein